MLVSGLLSALVLPGCSGSLPSAAPPTDGEISITSPDDGATVAANPLIVSGTAPPGAQVVRDIGFAPEVLSPDELRAAWERADETATREVRW